MFVCLGLTRGRVLYVPRRDRLPHLLRRFFVGDGWTDTRIGLIERRLLSSQSLKLELHFHSPSWLSLFTARAGELAPDKLPGKDSSCGYSKRANLFCSAWRPHTPQVVMACGASNHRGRQRTRSPQQTIVFRICECALRPTRAASRAHVSRAPGAPLCSSLVDKLSAQPNRRITRSQTNTIICA